MEEDLPAVPPESPPSPPTLHHFVGQRTAIETAKVALDAAFEENQPYPHTVMLGPPGVGKTLLAQILAREMAAGYQEIIGQSLSLQSEVHALLLAATDKSIVFIDECDEMPPWCQTTLYKAVEERRIFLEPAQPGRRSTAVPLANFTLIMASNHEHCLVQPLRDRMKLILRFDYYSPLELAEIIRQRCRQLNWPLENHVPELVALRGRGTPRIAIRLLEGCRRVCRSLGEQTISQAHFRKACQLEGIDRLGLDRNEVQLLTLLQEATGPVRLNVLAARLGLPSATIAMFEGYLIRQGLLERTPSGRLITAKGREHLASLAQASTE